MLVEARAEGVGVDELEFSHGSAPLCHVDKC